MKALAISLILISLATGLNAGLFSSISQAIGFSSIEEPGYTVIEKLEGGVEVREYEASKWVGVTVQTELDQYKQSTRGNFMKLFKYISNANDQSMKMEMTAPVTMTLSSKSAEKLSMKSQANVTMAFFVGRAHQGNTPVPTDEQLKIQSVSSRTVASIRFGGFTSMAKNLEKRDELIAALGADRASQYDQVNFITAGYDAPFKFFNRRNEIWLVKK